jgi:hypothetical protein
VETAAPAYMYQAARARSISTIETANKCVNKLQFNNLTILQALLAQPKSKCLLFF